MSDKENPPPPGNNQRKRLHTPRETIHMFNAREIGGSLTEVAIDLIKSEDRDIESRWYHSPHDADLFYWRDDQKNIIKQQVSFLGQLLEWNVVEGVRTGLLIESAQGTDMSSPIIRFDSSPQQKTLEQGLEILVNITSMDDEVKQRIMHNFVRAPRLSSLGADEILEKYGRYLGKPGLKETGKRKKWWQWFK
jgi:hypothetical protein